MGLRIKRHEETLYMRLGGMSRWFSAMTARISTCIVFHELWSYSGVDGRGHFCRMDLVGQEEVSIGEMRLMHLEHVYRWWHIVCVLCVHARRRSRGGRVLRKMMRDRYSPDNIRPRGSKNQAKI